MMVFTGAKTKGGYKRTTETSDIAPERWNGDIKITEWLEDHGWQGKTLGALWAKPDELFELMIKCTPLLDIGARMALGKQCLDSAIAEATEMWEENHKKDAS